MTHSTSHALRAALLAGVTLLAVLVLPLAAFAQSFDTEYPVERFRLSMSSAGILNAESADVPEHLTGEFSAWFGYANDPLTLSRDVNGSTTRVASLVSERVGGSLIGSIALFDQLEVAVFIPLILMQDQDPGSLTGLPSSISGGGLGNVRLATKVQLLKAEEFAVDVSILASVNLPTSTSEYYFGDAKTGAEFELLLSRNLGSRARAAVNVGYRLRTEKNTLDLRVDDEFYLHGGAAFRFTKYNEVSASLSFATGTTDGEFGKANRNASEALVGLSHDFGRITLFSSGGIGVSDGFGTPDWRALGGVRLAFGGGGEARDEGCGDDCSAAVEEIAPSLVDADHDGVADRMDRCPGTEPGLEVGSDGCALPVIPTPALAVAEPVDPDMTLNIEFPSGSADLLPEHDAELARAAEILLQHPTVPVVIEGHTDSVGSDDDNQRLSEQRAAAVLRHLVDEHEVDDTQLTWEGYGENRPVAENETAEGRRLNRRVSLAIDDVKPAAPAASAGGSEEGEAPLDH